jgi:transposase InsO family protein
MKAATSDGLHRARARKHAASLQDLICLQYVGWFNDARLHESLGDIPPAEFEALDGTSVFSVQTDNLMKTY